MRISEQEEAREPFHRLWIYGSHVVAADALAWCVAGHVRFLLLLDMLLRFQIAQLFLMQPFGPFVQMILHPFVRNLRVLFG